MFRRFLLIAIFCSLIDEFYISKADAKLKEEIEITIYHQDLGLVKDRRFIEFKKDKNIIKFTDIASLIDPTSVSFKALAYENEIKVQEQYYEYDLVNTTKVLEKYINRQIQVITKDNQIYEGILLSADSDQLILAKTELKGPITIILRENIRNIKLPELPEQLITKPTLILETISNISGKKLCELTYLTKGIKWSTDYIAIVDDKDEKLDLTGWVTIDNNSGATYKNAKLKLIAGDIHRVKPREMVKKMMAYEAAIRGENREFEKEGLFEYYIYTLTRPTTLKDKQTKQISLLASYNIPCKKIYTYNGIRYGKRVQVTLQFVNSKDNGLGIPLPKGKFRVYKADKEHSLQFIGEDEINHTPKDAEVKIYIGDAFDIVGERKQIEHRRITQRIYEETYEIEIKNHKEEDIEVLVIEPQRGNWKITKSTHNYQIKDAHTVEFKINVKKNKKEIIRYTVEYHY